MTSGMLDTLLLFASPASGKPERRRYQTATTSEPCLPGFGLGPIHRGLQETFQPLGR